MPDFSSSDRTAVVQTPIIPTINQWVQQHPGTISLGQGVAFYGPPKQTYAYLEHHLHERHCDLYGPVEGLPELQQALTDKLRSRNNVEVSTQQALFVTAGSNMAFSSLMLAITDPGDEIILLTPYYFNHEMAIRLANARPVLVPTLANFHPDIDAIQHAITAKTRAIVTVSPNNPTGAVYTPDELIAINQLCVQHGLYHISDEAYEDFVYDHHQHYSVAQLDASQAHTISLFSLSKAYGFAGWRVGYMLLPRALLLALKKVQDTVLISPPIVSQLAAIGAHQAPYHYIQDKLAVIDQARRHCLSRLNQSGLLATQASAEGAFYVFAQLKIQQDDLRLSQTLIRDHAVAVIPGSAFAAPAGTYLRISYGALTPATVQQGISQLITGLHNLTG
ncbi:MAG: aspartate aminotransferase [Gammaproteobacteria bacterium TMED119]|nr:MAG: aspartate aminotransferase [Gammaproteobacteria bacterium TMED119]|tara:strand:- start:3036 stop:4208 length:1173 start_codon:yes stop_codon:yes gene_type:complete